MTLLRAKAVVRSILGAGLPFVLLLTSAPAAPAQAPLSFQMMLTPAETVVAFYAALQAREFTAAYAFFSPNAQAERPFAAWADGYLTTVRIDVQAFPGDTPASVRVELWASDGETPRVHGYVGTWWLVRDALGQRWLLDDAQIDAEPPPAFPFGPRPSQRCAPVNPDPATAILCDFTLNVPVPARATITVTAVGPQPVSAPLNAACDSLTGGLSCLPATGLPNPFSVKLVCLPSLAAETCPIDAHFTASPLSLNGGPLSETLTISAAEDGTSPTFFVLPSPPVTFTTLVPPPPPPPSPSSQR